MAKDVKGLHHDENAIDREEALKKQFEKAQEQDNKPEPKFERESRMVREDAPGPSARPTGPMRWGPDERASAARLAQERREAEAHQKAAEAAWERLHGQQREAGREQDNEPVYGNPVEEPPKVKGVSNPATEHLTREESWQRFQERQAELDRELDPGRERE